MNKGKGIKIMNYLSLLLVLSFFILHNIFIVFTGLLLAIYLINIDYIINNLKNRNARKNHEDESNKPNLIKIEYKNFESENEDKSISLVELIEESGFIPSLKKVKDKKAA